MRHYIKEISKHGVIYTVSNILTRAIGFILIPIYARYLNPEEYGIISIVVSIIGFYAIIFPSGLISAFSRLFFDVKDKSKEQKDLLGSIVVSIFIFSLFLSLIFTFFSKPLFDLIVSDIEFYPYVVLAIWISFFMSFYTIKLDLFRIRQQSIQFGVFSLGKFVGVVSLTIIAIVGYDLGALGKIGAELIVVLVFAIISILLLLKDITIKIKLSDLKNALKYGLPIIPHSLAGVILIMIDKFFIANYIGLGYTGIYSMGAQISAVMGLIVFSIHLSWNPFFIKLANEKKDEAKQVFSKLTTYYIMVVLFLAIVISFFSKEIITIFTSEKYYEASDVIPILVFSYVFQGMYYMAVTKMYYVKSAIKYLPIASIISVICNIVLNMYLIPKYHMYGAAWASFISLLISFGITYYISQRVYHIKYDFRRILILFILTIVILFLFVVVNNMSLKLWMLIAIKIIIVSFFFVFLYLIKFLSINEYENLRNIVYKMLIRYKLKN